MYRDRKYISICLSRLGYGVGSWRSNHPGTQKAQMVIADKSLILFFVLLVVTVLGVYVHVKIYQTVCFK